MNLLVKSIALICISLLSLPSVAVTLLKDIPRENVINQEKHINATLTERHQSGELHTSQGIIKLTPAVKVDDQRAIDDWYQNPTKANISLIYKDKRLVRVVIY